MHFVKARSGLRAPESQRIPHPLLVQVAAGAPCETVPAGALEDDTQTGNWPEVTRGNIMERGSLSLRIWARSSHRARGSEIPGQGRGPEWTRSTTRGPSPRRRSLLVAARRTHGGKGIIGLGPQGYRPPAKAGCGGMPPHVLIRSSPFPVTFTVSLY